MNDRDHQIAVVSGFIKTGSSALIDILREIDSVSAFLPEFQIFANRDGLYEVIASFDESHEKGMSALKRYSARLLKEGESLTAYHKLRNWLARQIRNGPSSSLQMRRGYDRMLRGGYKESTVRYLRNLQLILSSRVDTDPVSVISGTTHKYFQHLCRHLDVDGRSEVVVFNQTIKPSKQTNLGLKILPQARVIVVDRDPRDQYVDMLRYHRLNTIPENRGVEDGRDLAEGFISWYRRRREGFYNTINASDHLYVVRFENICLNYHATREGILHFLNLKSINRQCIGSKFDHNRARSKVGLWRKFEDQMSIRQIEETLGHYCYDG